MRVFLDTNVLLDVLGARQPFYRAAAEVWSMAERGDLDAFVSAISFSNVYTIVRKASGKPQADQALRTLRGLFQIVAPDTQIVNQAMDADIGDFEDAIQFHSAIHAKATHLLTRDPSGFPESSLHILSPDEFIAALRESEKDPIDKD